MRARGLKLASSVCEDMIFLPKPRLPYLESIEYDAKMFSRLVRLGNVGEFGVQVSGTFNPGLDAVQPCPSLCFARFTPTYHDTPTVPCKD